MPNSDANEITLTRRQARRFLLLRHGLAGTHRFTGKQGIFDFIEMAGCIQFDPIAVFDFEYKWEIYTPQAQRKYGYYVLPVLYGDGFAGRMEAVCDRKRKVLTLKNFWPEEGFAKSAAFERAFEKSLNRFARFNGCKVE